MERFPARLIPLAPDERRTLSTLVQETPAVPLAAAARHGVVDVGDPAVRAWMSARRDALLAREGDDDHDGLALVARLLSDALDLAAAA
jgi:hypothetical protein